MNETEMAAPCGSTMPYINDSTPLHLQPTPNADTQAHLSQNIPHIPNPLGVSKSFSNPAVAPSAPTDPPTPGISRQTPANDTAPLPSFQHPPSLLHSSSGVAEEMTRTSISENAKMRRRGSAQNANFSAVSSSQPQTTAPITSSRSSLKRAAESSPGPEPTRRRTLRSEGNNDTLPEASNDGVNHEVKTPLAGENKGSTRKTRSSLLSPATNATPAQTKRDSSPPMTVNDVNETAQPLQAIRNLDGTHEEDLNSNAVLPSTIVDSGKMKQPAKPKKTAARKSKQIPTKGADADAEAAAESGAVRPRLTQQSLAIASHQSTPFGDIRPPPGLHHGKLPTPPQNHYATPEQSSLWRPTPDPGHHTLQPLVSIADIQACDDEKKLAVFMKYMRAQEIEAQSQKIGAAIEIRQLDLYRSKQSGTPAPFSVPPVATEHMVRRRPTPSTISTKDGLEIREDGDVKPVHNAVDDSRFVTEICQWFKKSQTANPDTIDFGEKAKRRLAPLLQAAKPPSDEEALFLTGAEAAEYLKPGAFFSGPIITEGQQALPLQTPEEFLDGFYDDGVKVWIQDQAMKVSSSANHARQVAVESVRNRLKNPGKSKPWNCLELAAHRDDGIRPAYLNNEDCSLLTKIKQPGKNEEASRRGFEQGWREVEKWALLAQAGALTEPHQDSHGYSTFITINHGLVGFGWLSNPTPAQHAAWSADPLSYSEGEWRYIVLRPGQTIYFPSGTVHFVFRLPKHGNTLAFGGHILRSSQIANWARTMANEQLEPNVTNEDLRVAAVMYLNRVTKYVTLAMKKGDEDMAKWGGKGACEEFLKLKDQILSRHEVNDNTMEEQE